jgi:hypothetical protein
MFSGPPLPLADDLPLNQLALITQDLTHFGAWVRGRSREQRLYIRAPGRCCRVLISADLGALLRSCRHVVVREGTRALVLDADVLIQWRTLQVVTATPYLPGIEQIKAQFPALQLTPDGLSVPIRGCSPESVLAECLARGIQVSGSTIIYDADLTRLAELGSAPLA